MRPCAPAGAVAEVAVLGTGVLAAVLGVLEDPQAASSSAAEQATRVAARALIGGNAFS